MIAGLLYGIVSVYNDPWWQSAQPDLLIVLPLALALLCYDAARGRLGPLIAAGAILGFACQLRYQMVLFIPFFPLVELIEVRDGRLRLWLHRMVVLGIGFGAMQAAFLVYLAAGGALGEFIRTMRYAAGYTRLGGPWNSSEGPTLVGYLQTLRDGFAWWAYWRMVLTLPAVVGAVYGALFVREPRVQRLAVFAVLSYVAIALQAKFFWYHFGHFFLTLPLLGGWVWDQAIISLRRAWPRPLTYAFVVGMAVALALNTKTLREESQANWKHFVGYYRDSEGRATYYAAVAGGFATSREVALHVRANTRPGESIYVWGFSPQIYLMAERPTASRFLFSYPLMSSWTPQAWKDDFVAEMERNRPAYFIATRGQTANWIVDVDVDIAEYIQSYTALHEWLMANYEYEMDIGGFMVYR